jgi:hypothetical protein
MPSPRIMDGIIHSDLKRPVCSSLILKMRKLRHREVNKQQLQDYTVTLPFLTCFLSYKMIITILLHNFAVRLK